MFSSMRIPSHSANLHQPNHRQNQTPTQQLMPLPQYRSRLHSTDHLLRHKESRIKIRYLMCRLKKANNDDNGETQTTLPPPNPTPSSPITSPQIPTPAHQAHNNQPPLNPPEAQTNIPQNQPTQNQNTETSSSSLPSTTVTQPPQNHHPMTTRRENNIVKPKKKYHLSVSTTTSPFPEPQTVIQALKDKIWRDSMSQEMDGFCQEPDLPPCTALSIRM